MQAIESYSSAQPLEQVINVVRAACAGWNLAADDTVFINGSRVEGFENQYSDVDIWLVSKGSPDNITSIPVFSWIDGLHINSSAYSEEHMLALADLMNGITVDHHAQVRELPLNTLVRYYRVAVATPAVNPEGLASLQTHFSKEHLAALLARWAHIRSVTSLRDASVLLSNGQGFAAFLATRYAVDWAIDSHLASNGEANPSLKWRFEKLARRFGQSSELYTNAWDLKSMGDRSPQEYFLAGEQFITQLLPSGIDPAPAQPRLSDTVRAFEVGNEHFLVQHKAHMYQLDHTAMRVVEMIDGNRAEDAIASHLVSSGTSQGDLQTKQQQVTHVLERLRDYGLVGSYPDGR